MPRFAANLSLLYTEQPFLERFDAAAEDGFRGVECQFPYDWPAAEIATRLRHTGLQQVLINAPAGDWAAGERGIACLPGREAEFRAGFARALDYAQALDCPRIHVLAGLAPAQLDPARLQATYEANLAWAAGQAAPLGRQVLIEPINPRDFPAYFLTRQAQAHRLVETLGLPNLKVQMDLYHCQIVEGDLATRLRRWLPGGQVAHLQVAGVPERHEPDLGEVHYPYLFELIDALSREHGWTGWVGCEYRPRRGAVPGGTRDGLGWLRATVTG